MLSAMEMPRLPSDPAPMSLVPAENAYMPLTQPVAAAAAAAAVPERQRFFVPSVHTPLSQTRTPDQLKSQNEAMCHEPLLAKLCTANPFQMTLTFAELLFNYRVAMSKTHGGPFDNLSRTASMTSPGSGAVIPLGERRTQAEPYADGCMSPECRMGRLCDPCWTAYLVCKMGEVFAGIEPYHSQPPGSEAAQFKLALKPVVAKLFRFSPGSYPGPVIRYPAAEAAAAARADLKRNNGVDTRMTNRYLSRTEQENKAAAEFKLNGVTVKVYADSPVSSDTVSDLHSRCDFLKHMHVSPVMAAVRPNAGLPMAKSILQMIYDTKLSFTMPYHGSYPAQPFVGSERCKLLPDTLSEVDAITLAEARGFLDPKNVNRCYYCSVVYTCMLTVKPWLAEHELADAQVFCEKLFHPTLMALQRPLPVRRVTHNSVAAAAAAASSPASAEAVIPEAVSVVPSQPAPAAAAAAVAAADSAAPAVGTKRKRGRPSKAEAAARVTAAAVAASSSPSEPASTRKTVKKPRTHASPVVLSEYGMQLMKTVVEQYRQREAQEKKEYEELKIIHPRTQQNFWMKSAADEEQRLAIETEASDRESIFLLHAGIKFIDLYTETSRHALLQTAKLEPRDATTKQLVERVRVRLGRRWVLKPTFIDIEKVFVKDEVKQMAVNAFEALSLSTSLARSRQLFQNTMALGRKKTAANGAQTRWLCEAACAHMYYRRLLASGLISDIAFSEMVLALSPAATSQSVVKSAVKKMEKAGRTVYECPSFLFVDMNPYTGDGLKGFHSAFQVETDGCADMPVDHLRQLKSERRGLYETIWGEHCVAMQAYREFSTAVPPQPASAAAAAPAPMSQYAEELARARPPVAAAAAAAAVVETTLPAQAAAAAAPALASDGADERERRIESAVRYYNGLPGSDDC